MRGVLGHTFEKLPLFLPSGALGEHIFSLASRHDFDIIYARLNLQPDTERSSADKIYACLRYTSTSNMDAASMCASAASGAGACATRIASNALTPQRHSAPRRQPPRRQSPSRQSPREQSRPGGNHPGANLSGGNLPSGSLCWRQHNSLLNTYF